MFHVHYQYIIALCLCPRKTWASMWLLSPSLGNSASAYGRRNIKAVGKARLIA